MSVLRGMLMSDLFGDLSRYWYTALAALPCRIDYSLFPSDVLCESERSSTRTRVCDEQHT